MRADGRGGFTVESSGQRDLDFLSLPTCRAPQILTLDGGDDSDAHQGPVIARCTHLVPRLESWNPAAKLRTRLEGFEPVDRFDLSRSIREHSEPRCGPRLHARGFTSADPGEPLASGRRQTSGSRSERYRTSPSLPPLGTAASPTAISSQRTGGSRGSKAPMRSGDSPGSQNLDSGTRRVTKSRPQRVTRSALVSSWSSAMIARKSSLGWTGSTGRSKSRWASDREREIQTVGTLH